MRAGLIFIALLSGLIAPAAGSDWIDHGAVTLKWGETVNVSGYNISAVDFRPGTVEETKNETKCVVENDPGIRRMLGCDDWVMLAVFKKNVEILDAALSKRNITVDGVDFVNETTLRIDDETIRLRAEDVITGYNIPTPYATIRIFTISEKNELEFDIAGNLSIKKTVSPEAHINPSWSWISVVLDVENIGNMNISRINVVDSPPDDYQVEPAELGWSFSLNSGQKWQMIYAIKPIHPAPAQEYSLPKAKLYLINGSREYNISSNNASFKLFSSDIVLKKTVEKDAIKPGENVTIIVHVKNNGSRAALVTIKDHLPENGALVKGSLDFSRVLQPQDFFNNSYILRIDGNSSGNITIPAAELIFKEYKPGYDPERDPQAITGNITSQSPGIMVGSASLQLASGDSETLQGSENDEKKEDRLERSFVDGIIDKIRGLWIYISSVI